MCNGWIKLHRKILDWEWYDDTSVVRLFVHFLLIANNTDKKWRGIDIKKGQLVTSVAALSEQLGLSTKQIRIAIDKLKRTNEIAIKTTNKFTLVTICKYESYQLSEECKGQTKGQAKGQTEGNQTANKGQQLKNIKNIRNKETSTPIVVDEKKGTLPSVATKTEELLKVRQRKFAESLVPYIGKYGKEMIREFYDYWSEPNRTKKKFRMELQKTWSTALRLSQWANRSKTNGNKFKTASERKREANDYAIARLNASLNERFARVGDEEQLPI